MAWIKQSDDINISNWLKEIVPSNCEICHNPIENWYNKDLECTRRRCSNVACTLSMAAKAAKILDILDVSGIQEKTAAKIINQYGFKSYFDIIPYVFQENKKRITLAELFRFGFIFGIDDFTGIVQDYSTVEDVMNNYNGKFKDAMLEVQSELEYGEKVFEIIKPISNSEAFKYPALLSGDVNIHGAIPGMENDRDSFIPAINLCYKGFVRFGYAKSARRTGMFCCISQQTTGASNKLELAMASGYPIYTYAEFIDKINSTIISAGYEKELEAIFN